MVIHTREPTQHTAEHGGRTRTCHRATRHQQHRNSVCLHTQLSRLLALAVRPQLGFWPCFPVAVAWSSCVSLRYAADFPSFGHVSQEVGTLPRVAWSDGTGANSGRKTGYATRCSFRPLSLCLRRSLSRSPFLGEYRGRTFSFLSRPLAGRKCCPKICLRVYRRLE